MKKISLIILFGLIIAGCSDTETITTQSDCAITSKEYLSKINELNNSIQNLKNNITQADWFINSYIPDDEINEDLNHVNYLTRSLSLTQNNINKNCVSITQDVSKINQSIKSYNKVSEVIDEIRLNYQEIISSTKCEENNNCSEILNSKVSNIINDGNIISYKAENSSTNKDKCELNKAFTMNKLNVDINKLTNYRNLINQTRWLKLNLDPSNYNSELAQLNNKRNKLRMIYIAEFKFVCSEYKDLFNQYKPELIYIDKTTPILISLKNKYRNCDSKQCMEGAFTEFTEKTKPFDEDMKRAYQKSINDNF